VGERERERKKRERENEMREKTHKHTHTHHTHTHTHTHTDIQRERKERANALKQQQSLIDDLRKDLELYKKKAEKLLAENEHLKLQSQVKKKNKPNIHE